MIAVLASSQAIGGEPVAPQVISQWAVLASRSNLAGAPETELLRCLEAFPDQLDLIAHDGPFPEGARSYVALVSWGVGWRSMSLSDAAVDHRGEGC